MDLLVNLYDTGAVPLSHDNGLSIRRALSPDREKTLAFVRAHWSGWESECACAFAQQPPTCFLALRGKELAGFACYDATARGYFGPIGVCPEHKGGGVGRRLLYAALAAMREEGYGYAVIGWMDSALDFYRRSLNCWPIPGSQPQNTIYQRLTLFETNGGI